MTQRYSFDGDTGKIFVLISDIVSSKKEFAIAEVRVKEVNLEEFREHWECYHNPNFVLMNVHNVRVGDLLLMKTDVDSDDCFVLGKVESVNNDGVSYKFICRDNDKEFLEVVLNKEGLMEEAAMDETKMVEDETVDTDYDFNRYFAKLLKEVVLNRECLIEESEMDETKMTEDETVETDYAFNIETREVLLNDPELNKTDGYIPFPTDSWHVHPVTDVQFKYYWKRMYGSATLPDNSHIKEGDLFIIVSEQSNDIRFVINKVTEVVEDKVCFSPSYNDTSRDFVEFLKEGDIIDLSSLFSKVDVTLSINLNSKTISFRLSGDSKSVTIRDLLKKTFDAYGISSFIEGLSVPSVTLADRSKVNLLAELLNEQLTIRGYSVVLEDRNPVPKATLTAVDDNIYSHNPTGTDLTN